MADILLDACDEEGGQSEPGKPAESADAEREFRERLLALLPFLRAFSRTLCGDTALAEDVVQDALCKAWEARQSFRPGTNLKAWSFKILRNCYYNHCRRVWRRPALDEALAAAIEAPPDEQMWAVHLADTIEALDVLSVAQRKALILVTLGGATYSDVAAICNCPVGTVKSRVTRARKYVLSALQTARKPNQGRRVRADMAVDTIVQELTSLQMAAKQGI
jgi:RNA polymerase sigma-70 factor (ECF subfamily)